MVSLHGSDKKSRWIPLPHSRPLTFEQVLPERSLCHGVTFPPCLPYPQRYMEDRNRCMEQLSQRSPTSVRSSPYHLYHPFGQWRYTRTHKDSYHQGTVTIDDLTPSYPPSSVRNVVWTTPLIMTRHLHNTGGGRSTYLPALVKLGLSLTQTNFNSRSAVLTLPSSEYPTQQSNHSQSTLMQYANFHLQLRPLIFRAGLALSTTYQTMPNYVI